LPRFQFLDARADLVAVRRVGLELQSAAISRHGISGATELFLVERQREMEGGLGWSKLDGLLVLSDGVLFLRGLLRRLAEVEEAGAVVREETGR
jgi:hypothetical protein